MSYFEYVYCPYCNKEVNCLDIEFDESDETNFECSNCEREFEIQREWYPSFTVNEINYCKCEECGRQDRDISMLWTTNDKCLCRSCYFKSE